MLSVFLSFVTAQKDAASAIHCPMPTFNEATGGWSCPDQTLSLEQRRTLFESMKPFDEINGLKLDEFWPATAGDTKEMAPHFEYDYEGIDYKAYRLVRPTGERAPLHYHEVAQQLCLEKGKILVMTQGQPDKYYQAPDCYMMPAYTKVTVISLETKVETCLLRVPKGGLDWVVIEPKYYDLQGQWDMRSNAPTDAQNAQPAQAPVQSTADSLGMRAPVTGGFGQPCGARCDPGLVCRTEYHGNHPYRSDYTTATCQYSDNRGGWNRPCNPPGSGESECDHWLQYCDTTQNPPRCIPFWGRN